MENVALLCSRIFRPSYSDFQTIQEPRTRNFSSVGLDRTLGQLVHRCECLCIGQSGSCPRSPFRKHRNRKFWPCNVYHFSLHVFLLVQPANSAKSIATFNLDEFLSEAGCARHNCLVELVLKNGKNEPTAPLNYVYPSDFKNLTCQVEDIKVKIHKSRLPNVCTRFNKWFNPQRCPFVPLMSHKTPRTWVSKYLRTHWVYLLGSRWTRFAGAFRGTDSTSPGECQRSSFTHRSPSAPKPWPQIWR